MPDQKPTSDSRTTPDVAAVDPAPATETLREEFVNWLERDLERLEDRFREFWTHSSLRRSVGR